MEDGDKDGLSLTPEDQRFIEALGLHFEDRAGFPRIGGRMLGLLMLASKPMALGTIAELLKVSPASVSTNIRAFHTKGLVEEIGLPGDRRHYYVFSDTAFEHQFDDAMEGLTEVLQIMRTRMERLGGRREPCACSASSPPSSSSTSSWAWSGPRARAGTRGRRSPLRPSPSRSVS